MLTDVEVLLDDEAVLGYMLDGKYKTVSYAVFRQYWSEAEPDFVENAGVRWSSKGSTIIGYLTGASGQTGVIFGWNAVTETFFHISDGNFVVGIACTNKTMYSLACVSYYGHPATYCLNAAPIESMDIEAGEEIKMITELPGTTDVIANSLYINSDKNMLIVKTEDKDIELYHID